MIKRIIIKLISSKLKKMCKEENMLTVGENKNDMKVIYCRLESNSSSDIQNQKDMLFAYAEENNLHVHVDTYPAEYAEANHNSPVLNALLQDAQVGKIETVLVAPDTEVPTNLITEKIKEFY